MRLRVLISSLVALAGAVVVAPVVAPAAAAGQPFTYAQECITSVHNATVHLPANAAPTLPSGAPLAAGDTVAVYTADGTCAGYGVWKEGEGATLAAAGTDSIDASPDGYATGAALKFEVFDVSASRTVEVGAAASFVPCDEVDVSVCRTGTYEKGTFHEVAEFESETAVTRTLTLAEGWNFISMPVQSPLPFGELLPACSSGYFYVPGEGYTAIGNDETLPAGTGAVVQCAADTTSVTGQPASPLVEVEEGWNLVGGTEDTVAAGAVVSTPSGILASAFFRLPPGEGYQPATELRPGEGYWVKTTAAGTLDVSGEPVGLANASQGGGGRLTEASRLVLTDANGRSSTLWLKEGLSTEQRRRFERPPVPPGDVFDVRFAGGYAAAAIDAAGPTEPRAPGHRIQMQGGAFPVEVRLKTDDARHRFTLSAGANEFSLSDEQSSVRIQQATDRFAVAAAQVPRAFELGTVFPNPIRDRAQLTYAVPNEAEVSIAVYDLLGRRVARLVEGRKEAGVHRARLDAGRLASGRYFVQMQAEGVRKTRSLTVVR